jgi:hypothetical protein
VQALEMLVMKQTGLQNTQLISLNPFAKIKAAADLLLTSKAQVT